MLSWGGPLGPNVVLSVAHASLKCCLTAGEAHLDYAPAGCWRKSCKQAGALDRLSSVQTSCLGCSQAILDPKGLVTKSIFEQASLS